MKTAKMKTSKNPILVSKTFPIKRYLAPEIIAKGTAALAEWRKEKAYAEKKGGKFLEAWVEEQALKKARKGTSPMQAIKNFCNECVGGIRSDITDCTAKQCKLYMYRPYQKGETE